MGQVNGHVDGFAFLDGVVFVCDQAYKVPTVRVDHLVPQVVTFRSIPEFLPFVALGLDFVDKVILFRFVHWLYGIADVFQ